mgnify:CR=1 FL=1
MGFKLKRNDGKKDYFSSLDFINYEEAYDFIEKELGSLCCSDTDFEKDIYYEIIKD